MTDVLYDWPKAAAFGRPVPKTKFYEHLKVSTALKAAFVNEVAQITWAFKLAPRTVNLPATAAVAEIQVFTVASKDNDVGDAVLAAVDKAVTSPILFEVVGAGEHAGQVRLAATYKPSSGSARSGYLTTAWMPVSSPRMPLPVAVDLGRLYDALVSPLLPLSPTVGESVGEALDRADQIKRLDRDLAALERRLRNEPQFNRKVDLRRQVLDLKAQLARLISGPLTQQKDPSWTS